MDIMNGSYAQTHFPCKLWDAGEKGLTLSAFEWEKEKSYPDIISVIELSSLYSISLDDLLKGDERMMEHLEESTNVVKSNQKLIGAIILNIITVILLITLSMFLPDKIYYLIMVFCLAIVSSAVLLYQIIRRI